MARMAREGQMPQRVLDVGAGSGVLAIAAVRMGVSFALAVDIDELATRAVVENATRNGVEKCIEARTAVPADLDGLWPLVLANIQLAVFADCAADITRLVVPGGRLIVSGILLEQKDACLNLFSGFEVEELREREGWLGLLLRRKAS
jgi:ribosomal protein L11 methyltransferase